MKKEMYERTEISVYVFETEDVIVTSPFNPDPNEGSPVSG